ncbi:hypothetical protein B0H16DRAFT_1489831 [Mycena metata]|uniref:ditrans,polycis-polyprenyl diphosphate synthase [(2E,6E)-farnesyldiphosphate specific] n=1 Tax=Mycena metata TaxID=1033252 RepID=A0AAD7KL58_9AGAR|nr:hypothetical protein B0H16DRAFT_1489831 [Mycena metata]
MAILEYVLLRVIHSFHFLVALWLASWRRLRSSTPLPLEVTRRRIPNHLAVLLVPDSIHEPAATLECLLETVNRTIGWCRSAGIQQLTLYDNDGVLMNRADQISQRASISYELNGYESSESDVQYPLTPPSSDYSDSRPLSPEDGFQRETPVITIHLPETIHKKTSRYGLKKRHAEREKSAASQPPLTLCIASRRSSKPAIAAAATLLARRRVHALETEKESELSVGKLNSILEGPNCLPAPDFLIVHHLRPFNYAVPLELHGFPPWQIRLTEIYHSHRQRPLLGWLGLRSKTAESAPQFLTEVDFRTALDEFAGAEMRFGK